MKTLIVTAAAALLSTSAFAFDSSWDASEFYSGNNTSSSVQGANLSSVNNNLYTEGNFVEVDTSKNAIEGIELGTIGEPAALYLEGNYDV